jgi:hypothetical protein
MEGSNPGKDRYETKMGSSDAVLAKNPSENLEIGYRIFYEI